MIIPTSVVDVVLLFAIPMIASFINFVSDSTMKRSPRMNIFPVTSKLELITVPLAVAEIYWVAVSRSVMRPPWTVFAD